MDIVPAAIQASTGVNFESCTTKPGTSLLLTGGSTESPTSTTSVVTLVDAVSGDTLSKHTGPAIPRVGDQAAPLRMFYLSKTDKLLLVQGTKLRLIAPTIQETFLLHSLLHFRPPKTPLEEVILELPYQDAQQLYQSLKLGVLAKDDEVRKWAINPNDLQDITKQIFFQTFQHQAESNKRLQFITINLRGTYSTLKQITNAIITHSVDMDLVSVAYGLQEMLRRYGEAMPQKDTLGFISKQKPNNMHIELSRLKSFANFPKTTNREATPFALSKAGFYYAPAPHQTQINGKFQMVGGDTCLHFSASLQLSNWDGLRSPLEELTKGAPNDPFTQGKPTGNVTLAYSLSVYPPLTQVQDMLIDSVSSAPHSGLLAIRSGTWVSIWDTTVELRQLFVFPIIPLREGPFVIVSLFLVPCTEGSSATASAPQQAKWEEWCTPGIEVYADKGLYSGTKGFITDVAKGNIQVFLNGLGEIVPLRIDHILPIRPKAGQRAKILHGDLKGQDVQVHNIPNATSAIVRLVAANTFISVPLNSLASLAQDETTAADKDAVMVSPLRENCIIVVLAQGVQTIIRLFKLNENNSAGERFPVTESEGTPVLAAFVRSSYVLVVLVHNGNFDGKAVYKFLSFEYSPETLDTKPIVDDIAILELPVEDNPVQMEAVDVESVGSGILVVLTHSGRVFALQTEPQTEIIAKYDHTSQPSGSAPASTTPLTFKSFTFLPGDNKLACVASDGTIRYLSLQSSADAQSAASPSAALSQEQMLAELGPISLDNLSSLQTFDQEYHQFSSFPPVTKEGGAVKQQMLEGNTSVRWQLPEHTTSRALVFEIELARMKRLDTVQMELGMALPRLAWKKIADGEGPKYSLSLQYFHLRKGWITVRQLLSTCDEVLTAAWQQVVDQYSLTGIISSGDAPDSEDTKIRIGNLPIPGNVISRKLKLTLHNADAPPEDEPEAEKIAKRFHYSSDFDENGVLFWIGTNGGKNPWTNPAADGRVKVEVSHEKLPSPEMKKSDIIARKATQAMYWGGSVPEWFLVDLGPDYRLLCDCYTLRHGYQHANSYLQNWMFQGSEDAENWISLHEGFEPSFTKGFDTRSFPVVDAKQHYRYFRVCQKGNYSMGSKPGTGSPFMCIAGFELYGELITEPTDGPTANRVQSLAVRFAMLKPSRGYNMNQTLTRRQSLAECTEFHRRLIKKTCESDTTYEVRNICIDMLVDLWSRFPQKIVALALEDLQKNLPTFLQWNLVKAEKSTTIRAGRLLDCLLSITPKSFDEAVLHACLDVLPKAVDEFEFRDGMNQMLLLIQSCWSCDEQRSLNGCLDVILKLGKKLYDSRSPFYNLLRRYFGLYGHPLELDLFEIPKGGYIVDPNSSTASASSSTPAAGVMPSPTLATKTSTVKTVVVPPVNNPKEVLEHQLLACSLEFAAARRTLTTTLEEINLSGAPSDPLARDIGKAYNECLVAQQRYFRVHKKLRKFKPEAFKTDDRKLSRWTSAAEQLFSILNQKHESAAAHATGSSLLSPRTVKSGGDSSSGLDSKSGSLEGSGSTTSSSTRAHWSHSKQLTAQDLLELFTKFCVFTTPALRHEATRFLTNHISLVSTVDSVVDFPRLVLQRFFSRRSLDNARPLDIFPQQEVFEALQEIINEDRFRFFYVENLFVLLEELSAVLPDSDSDEEDTHLRSGSDDLGLESSLAVTTPSKSTTIPRNDSKAYLMHSLTLEEDVDVPLVSWLLLLLSNTMARAGDNVPVHKGSRCRICNMSPICGVRFRCANCLDYDICENCEATNLHTHNRTHLFIQIPTALPLQPSMLGMQPPKEPLLPVFYTLAQLQHMDAEEKQHHHIECNECDKEIVGVRYKCVHCPEFNICEDCEETDIFAHTPLHLFLKVRYPLPATPLAPPSPQPKLDPSPAALATSPPAVVASPSAKPLIPLVLNHGFYPYAHFKDQGSAGSASGAADSAQSGAGIPNSSPTSPRWYEKLSKSVTDASKLKSQMSDGSDSDSQLDSSGDLQHHMLSQPLLNSNSSSSSSGPTLKTRARALHQSAEYVRSPSDPDFQLTLAQAGPPPGSSLSLAGGGRYERPAPPGSRQLRSIFSVICLSADMQPISPELLMLSIRLLESVANQYTPQDIVQDVIKFHQFDGFLRHVATYPSSFIRSAVLHLIEHLLQPATYSFAESRESFHVLRDIRGMIRAKAIHLLRKPGANAFNFLFELLLLATTDKDMREDSTATALLTDAMHPSFGSRDDGYPIDHIAHDLIAYLAQEVPLTSSMNARTWCMVLRLVNFAHPGNVIRADYFVNVLNEVLVAAEELQVLLVDELEKLLVRLLTKSGPEKSALLQVSIFQELVQSFPEVLAEANTLVFLRMIEILNEHLTPSVDFTVDSIGGMLQVLSQSLPDPLVTHPSDNERNKLIKECLTLVITILDDKSRQEVVAELFQWQPQALSFITPLFGPKRHKHPPIHSNINPAVAVIRSPPARRVSKDESDHSFARQLLIWLSALPPERPDAPLTQRKLAASQPSATMSAPPHPKPDLGAGASAQVLHSAPAKLGGGPASAPASTASISQPSSAAVPTLVQRKLVTKTELGKKIVSLITIAAKRQISCAKTVLQLAVDVLRNIRPNSVALAELCSAVISQSVDKSALAASAATSSQDAREAVAQAEELAYYFLVELEGVQFLFDQLKAANTGFHSSFLVPAFASMLSHGKSFSKSRSSAPQRGPSAGSPSTRTTRSLENLSSVCELLSPKDKQLERILKEVLPSTAPIAVWQHDFRAGAAPSTTSAAAPTLVPSVQVNGAEPPATPPASSANTKHSEDRLVIELGLPDNVILREIRIDCVSNVGTSRFPPFVTIQTGASVARLLPAGRFPCKQPDSPTLPTPLPSNQRITATFSFPLPEVELVKFVRIHIHAPKRSSVVALSKIQVLGQSPLTFALPSERAIGAPDPDAATTPEESVHSPVSHHLPLSTTLKILDQTMRWGKVQAYLTKNTFSELPETILPLLDALSPRTSTVVSNLATYLAQHDSVIANLMLSRLLKGTTQAHAALAGRICSIGGATSSRLNQLSAFVFGELSSGSSSSLSSHLTPFLDALSDAIAANRRTSATAPSVSVSEDQVRVLLRVGIAAMDGSLLQQGAFRLLSHILQCNPTHYTTLLNDFVKKFDITNRTLYVVLSIGRAGPLAEAQEAVIDGTAAITIFPYDFFGALGLLASSSPNTAQILLQSALLDKLVDSLRNVLLSLLDKSSSLASQSLSLAASNPASALGPAPSNSELSAKEALKESTAQFQAIRFLEGSLDFLSSVAHDASIKAWLGEHAFEVLFELVYNRSFGSRVPFATQEVLRQALNLNPANQQRTAEFLASQCHALANLHHLSGAASASTATAGGTNAPTLGSFPKDLAQRDVLLSLATEMFSIQDKVVIALHPTTPGSGDDTLRNLTLVTVKPDPIKLDRSAAHANLDVDADGFGVAANANATTGWRTVIAERPLTQGVRKWEVVLEKITSTANVMIGVCERSHKLSAYIGQAPTGGKGWSYYGATTGYTYHDGKSDSRYGQKMSQGDVITVTLDMDENTLAFARNGEDLGVAFRDIKAKELFPAISLYDTGDRVKLREVDSGPIDKGRSYPPLRLLPFLTAGLALSEARIEATSPLIFQRTGALFSLPVNTTLQSIVTSISADETKAVIFRALHPQDPKKVLYLSGEVLKQIRLGDLLSTGSSGEIIDLSFEIRAPPVESSTGSVPQANPNSSLLRKFVETEGAFPALMAIIDDQLRQREEDARILSKPAIGATTSAPASTTGSSPAPGTASFPERTVGAPIAVWKRWAQLLSLVLSVRGFVDSFTRGTDCRLLFFHVLQMAQRQRSTTTLVSAGGPAGPAPGRQRHRMRRSDSLAYRARPESVREISSRLGLVKNYLPPPSHALLTDPIKSLLDMVFKALGDTTTRDLADNSDIFFQPPESSGDSPLVAPNAPITVSHALSIRKMIADSGLLAFILSELIPLGDVMPRKPDNPAFSDAVRFLKKSKVALQPASTSAPTPLTTTPSTFSANSSDGKYWAKGTGFGTTSDDQTGNSWSHEEYVKEQAATARKIAHLLGGLCSFLTVSSAPQLFDPAVTPDDEKYPWQPRLQDQAYTLIEDSNLMPLLDSYLRNDSLLDMGRYLALYNTVLRLATALSQHENLIELLTSTKDAPNSLYTLLDKLHKMSDVMLRRLPKTALASHLARSDKKKAPQITSETVPKPVSAPSSTRGPATRELVLAPDGTEEADDEIALALEIQQAYSTTRMSVDRLKAMQLGSSQNDSSNVTGPPEPLKVGAQADEQAYVEKMKDLVFGEHDMTDPSGDYQHHYYARIKGETVRSCSIPRVPLLTLELQKTGSKKMKRLLQEITSFTDGLPLYYQSSIFLRVDTQRSDVMKCIITGPEGTPYAHGCFTFDIYLPQEYPMVPPLVNLQTTGNGTVRFNPNLYNEGKVCLSLLGTWRGGPNEQWNENTSTLLQVLISIQSLILVDKPYFNEPGYESSMNTTKGETQSRLYNEQIRLATIRWAMIEALRHPTPGFEEAIRAHFRLKRDKILSDINTWLEQAQNSRDKLVKLREELNRELQDLEIVK